MRAETDNRCSCLFTSAVKTTVSVSMSRVVNFFSVDFLLADMCVYKGNPMNPSSLSLTFLESSFIYSWFPSGLPKFCLHCATLLWDCVLVSDTWQFHFIGRKVKIVETKDRCAIWLLLCQASGSHSIYSLPLWHPFSYQMNANFIPGKNGTNVIEFGMWYS